MTRQELRDKFRAENPEITDRVITDVTLNTWMKIANKEVCCMTRCIVSNVPQTFNTTIGIQYYDLEQRISNFYDIDDLPGGGVYYNDEALEKASPSEMNHRNSKWLSAEDGTPKRWWMRGKYLWFDVAPDAADDVDVDCILLPSDFDSDSEQPFNELGYLQTYDDSISKYLQWRCKAKVGKPEEANIAKKDYLDYVAWMKKSVRSMKASPIQLKPKSYPSC
jgi:hypothetical protein